MDKIRHQAHAKQFDREFLFSRGEQVEEGSGGIKRELSEFSGALLSGSFFALPLLTAPLSPPK